MIERHEQFDEFLNDAFPTVRVMGMEFDPAKVLHECDPIAYRVMLNDWQSAQCEDGLHSHAYDDAIYCDFCGTQIEEGGDE